MLRDADLSLANWLRQILPPDTGVTFAAPRADWERRESGSAFVSAFLREVRRDTQDLARSGWSDARDQDGLVVGRQLAPRYYRLSYLITAWAQAGGGGDDADDEASRRMLEEHELLGLLVDACTATDAIPDDQLTGALAEAAIPCFVRCGGEESSSPAQSPWADFGIAPHAHLELELVAPVVPPLVTDLAPPAREIVLVAAQTPANKPTDDAPAPTAPAPVGAPPSRPTGTVRRWERSTIIERGSHGGPGQPGPAPQSGH